MLILLEKKQRRHGTICLGDDPDTYATSEHVCRQYSSAVADCIDIGNAIRLVYVSKVSVLVSYKHGRCIDTSMIEQRQSAMSRNRMAEWK